MSWTINNGRILCQNEFEPGSLYFKGERVSDAPAPGAQHYDARNALVLPGIIDVHGDGFERQILPRPKVSFPVDMALRETDRQLVANGITTAYHGITVSWEPGLRSVDSARDVVAAIKTHRAALACDTLLHLRWETFALNDLAEVLSWLKDVPHSVFALNDHTTVMMSKAQQRKKIPQYAARSGITEAEYDSLIKTVWERRDEVPAAIAHAVAEAHARDAVVFAHDEDSPEARRAFRAMGITTSEFPMTPETAREAREHGEHTVLGAPNVVRGGSHNGMMGAADAVRDGLCSVLASDYYYPAPLYAAFRLAADGVCSLPQAWDLISRNAAESVGLTDRGTITPGKRGDVVIVDAEDPGHPRVIACFVAGKLVYQA